MSARHAAPKATTMPAATLLYGPGIAGTEACPITFAGLPFRVRGRSLRENPIVPTTHANPTDLIQASAQTLQPVGQTTYGTGEGPRHAHYIDEASSGPRHAAR